MFRRVIKERGAISTTAVLTLSDKIYKKHFEGSVKNENLVVAVEHRRSQIQGKKIILIWYRAGIHKSKVTKYYLQQYPEIFIEELPAYAPQLNPEEILSR